VDQTRLPHDLVFVETDDYRTVAAAITRLEIRGAPAIGVAAAFAIVLAVSQTDEPEEQERQAAEAIAHLALTRPTAVNLFTSLKRMRTCVADPLAEGNLRDRLLAEAEAIRDEDIEACRRIAELGVELIHPGSTLLTHCHTGGLATAGGGTALFIIKEAHRRGLVQRVYVDETRPLLQGARLTAWELLVQQVDTVLVTDSTAGFLMQQKKVDAILVGADRITANGDVANKIGTYSLAVLASHHRLPFYVAAPLSTFDVSRASGDQIPIEERDASEITHVAGVRVAAKDVPVYAPAFDVTPANLITAIVTDVAVLRPPYEDAIRRLSEVPIGTELP
jgi:methylthioribose-1-phosphate isomerase